MKGRAKKTPLAALLWYVVFAGATAAAQTPAGPSPAPSPPIGVPSAGPSESPATSSPSAAPSQPGAQTPLAGIVPRDVTIELAGTVSPGFLAANVQRQIERQARMQPGTTLEVTGVTAPRALEPGETLEAQARIRINGQGLFADAYGTTGVHVRIDALTPIAPAVLFYSDDPEQLGTAAEGVLFRSTIHVDRAARTYAYHVSDTPDRRLFLALQAPAAGARVQVLGATAGPENAYAYVGHLATLRFLREHQTQESAIVDVAQGAPLLVPLGTRAFNPRDLVAATYDLRVLDGGPVTVEIVTASGDTDAVDLLSGPEVAGDGHGRRGEFALGAIAPLALSFSSGGAEPAPLAVGASPLPNLRPDGRPLGGDYGVLYDLSLQLTNPSGDPQNAYFYEMPASGAVTTTLWFAGDDRPTEIPCVYVPTNRYLIRQFALAPGETRTVTGEYMTDGASSYPLLFGLTAMPPSPPPGPSSADACNPHPPPASPSPAESASPAASAAPAVPSPSPAAPAPPSSTPPSSTPPSSTPQSPQPSARAS